MKVVLLESIWLRAILVRYAQVISEPFKFSWSLIAITQLLYTKAHNCYTVLYPTFTCLPLPLLLLVLSLIAVLKSRDRREKKERIAQHSSTDQLFPPIRSLHRTIRWAINSSSQTSIQPVWHKRPTTSTSRYR